MHTTARRGAALALAITAFALARPGTGQEPENVLPPSDRAPRLVLAHAGPHAPVTALAFAPDGSALYVAGFDKLVRRYTLVKGEFVAAGSFRVPVGPGNAGLINALAISPDGKWVAAAGRAPIRGEVWAGADDGTEADLRFASAELRGDVGIIYLFDSNNPDGGKAIRGPLSGVRALAFADPAPASGAALVTTGVEWTEQGEYFGALRVFDVASGKELASRTVGLPNSPLPPAVAAWGTADNKGLRVAVAWDADDNQAGKLLVWDNVLVAGSKPKPHDDGKFNSTLAVRRGKNRAVTELVTGAYHSTRRTGGLTVRSPDGSERDFVEIKGKADRAYLPMGVAVLATGGTAVVSRAVGGGTVEHDLRLLAPGAAAPVALDGLDPGIKPVLAASPDGRFLAIGGFTDNHVEVHDATALAAGRPGAPQKLAGEAGGFAKVAFLAGTKLWLGKPADTLEKGGVVLDLDPKARTAVPRGANEKLAIDSPTAPAPRIIVDAKKKGSSVVVPVGGVEKIIGLPEGEIATAAALLPAKPAWDADLGVLVAVAHVHERSRTVQLTLYDALTGKPLYKLGGPTLPVQSLAFSGSRALLAGAGGDGSVAVWSLKNVARPMPTVEGLLVSLRGNDVVVSTLLKNSPAAGKLAPGDVIESVVDGKGAARPIKEPLDFNLALRTLKIGADAQIKVRGKAPVAVKVGAGTGYRLPLFDLWVDPVAKGGAHAWVGWTSSGPYDASGADAESRIGWLTATGNAAHPVTLAGAEQYRKLFYTRDFLRRLIEKADYSLAALPPQPPDLKVTFTGAAELPDGRVVTRQKLNATVTLSDPDRVHDLSRAELRWQVVGPDGASEWVAEPFSGGKAVLMLTDREWKRGEYTVRAKLFRQANAPDAVPLEEAAADPVRYIPPAPELAVRIDGKPAATKPAVITAKPDGFEVSVTADAKFDPEGATVIVSWAGAKPVELKRNAGGFDPLTIPFNTDDTLIFVTATNRGAGANNPDESRTVEARVQKPAKVVLPPVVGLQVLGSFDFRATPDTPYVVSEPKVTLTATAESANPIAAFEWKLGAGDWQPGKFDPKTNTATIETDLSKLQKEEEKGVEVQVRATSNAKQSGTARATLRYVPLPEVTVTQPPLEVTGPELHLSGGLKLTSKRRFAVRVRVTSARGQVREFDPTPNAELTAWAAGVTLFPGLNQLGYIIKYDDDRKEFRSGLIAVKYAPLPLLLGGTPLEIGTGTSGTMSLVVVSAAEAPPELLVHGAPISDRTTKKPLRVFGVPVWVLTAAGVPANPGADRLEPVSVLVRNTESAGRVFRIAVRGEDIKKVAPPTIQLKYAGGAIAPDRPLPPVGEPDFPFEMQIRSDARLTRVEVWLGAGPDAKLELVPGVSAASAVPAGEGFALSARPIVRLRPGAGNYVRVVAANGGEPVAVAFYATHTPPPVRVVIDSITVPKGESIPVTAENATNLKVKSGVIEVAGRVLWDYDDEPAARDPGLAVVVVANGVSHLPIPVARAAGAKRERTFKGPVYLNAPDSTPGAAGTVRVRVDLRSGLRAVPQVGAARAALTIETAAPITRQRLHVIMLGVQVPTEKRGELVRRVITSIGGKIPADNPNFTEGRFERDRFEFAYLYPPRLGYTKGGDLNVLLDAVATDIEQRTKRPGEEWVNDVVLLYYQGADWQEEATGRWLLHTATTIRGAAGGNAADYAIRPDALRPVPGMLVVLVNVTGAEMKGDPLAIDTPHLRYAWTEPGATETLLGSIEKAVKQERTVEQMRRSVEADLQTAKGSAGRFGFLPEVVLARVIGLRP